MQVDGSVGPQTWAVILGDQYVQGKDTQGRYSNQRQLNIEAGADIAVVGGNYKNFSWELQAVTADASLEVGITGPGLDAGARLIQGSDSWKIGATLGVDDSISFAIKNKDDK